ncbi:hypothetical protein [Paraburkholderia atlantica]|uniref:hypothetical protein n=1 Tax=Paraburkholderia atlantica TaxID=2654982 RepID=UPI00187BA668|nr:hypothetical protein [Paraburkholderia atlantica]
MSAYGKVKNIFSPTSFATYHGPRIFSIRRLTMARRAEIMGFHPSLKCWLAEHGRAHDDVMT